MRLSRRWQNRRTQILERFRVISFHNADHPYRHRQIRKTRAWLEDLISGYDKEVGEIAVVFCTDSYLLEINQKELNHHDYTDIITFDYCAGDWISGDLYISVDRIRENARKFQVKPLEEMSRVMAHGVLHLIGFQDKTPQTQAAMRSAENRALAELFHVKP